jgi:DNA processing protein
MNTLEGRAWMALAAARGIGAKALWHIADYLFSRGRTASWLLRNPGHAREALPAMARNVGLPDPGVLAEGEGRSRRDATLLHPLHPDFPRRIKELRDRTALPALLYASGNLALLTRPAVAIVGRRDAEAAELGLSGELAAGLAAQGIQVVSGYAPGIDSAAHLGALRGRGSTTFVLAEGLNHLQWRPEFRGRLSDDNALLVSSFAPDSPWAAFQAMERNKLVAALADVLVVIASGAERDANGRMSGSFHAAVSALKLGSAVFAASPAHFPAPPPGNQELLSRGVRAWEPSSGPGPILAAVRAAAQARAPEQRNLF